MPAIISRPFTKSFPQRLWLLLILLPVLVLTFYNWALADSFWFDEMFSATMAGDSFGSLWKEWFRYDTHPPLYTLILWVWVRVFGSSELAGRGLSMLFFLAALLAFIRYTRKMPFYMVAVGLLISFPPITWYFAIEQRSYSLMLALSMIFFFRFRVVGRFDAVGAVLISLLSCTHFFGTIATCCFLLVWFMMLLKERRYGDLPGFLLAAFLALLPAVCFYCWQFFSGNMLNLTGGKFWIQTTTVNALRIYKGVLLPFAWSYIPLAAVAILIIALSIQWKKAFAGWIKEPFALTLLLAFVLTMLVNAFNPLIVARYLLVFLPLVGLAIMPWIKDPLLWFPGKSVGGMLGLILLVGVWQYYTWDTLHQKHQDAAAYNSQADYLQQAGLPVYSVTAPVADMFTRQMNESVANYYRRLHHPSQPSYMLLDTTKLGQLHKPFAIQLVQTQTRRRPDIMKALENYAVKKVEMLGREGWDAVLIVDDK